MNSSQDQNHGFIKRLKHRWGIHSTLQVVIILVVFACTGFSTLYVEDQLFHLMNIPDKLSWYMSVLFFIIITLPVYNILLLLFGTIFGQFRFFWNFEKRFFSFFLRIRR